MAQMLTDLHARKIAEAFIEYSNKIDELVWPGSLRPKFHLDDTEPVHVDRGSVFVALPNTPIPTDNPTNEHYVDRRLSVVVCTKSFEPKIEKVSTMQVKVLRFLPKTELADKTIDQLWGYSS